MYTRQTASFSPASRLLMPLSVWNPNFKLACLLARNLAITLLVCRHPNAERDKANWQLHFAAECTTADHRRTSHLNIFYKKWFVIFIKRLDLFAKYSTELKHIYLFRMMIITQNIILPLWYFFLERYIHSGLFINLLIN